MQKGNWVARKDKHDAEKRRIIVNSSFKGSVSCTEDKLLVLQC
jgi:hypothetical protein